MLIATVDSSTWRTQHDQGSNLWTFEDRIIPIWSYMRLFSLFWFLTGKVSNVGCNSWPTSNHPPLTEQLKAAQDGTLVWYHCSCEHPVYEHSWESEWRLRVFVHASLWDTVCPSDADELKRRLATVYNEKTVKVSPILWSNFQLH